MSPIILLIIMTLKISEGLIGFDCGESSANITTIDLLQTGDCEDSPNPVKEEDIYIQLLQIRDLHYTEITQCKVVVERQIHHCGTPPHDWSASDEFASFVQEVPMKTCLEMHTTGSYVYGVYGTIKGLKVNSTTTQKVTLSGRVEQDGTCFGKGYSNSYKTYDNVVVQAVIKITLSSGTVPVEIFSGKVMLKSKITCDYKDEECFDTEGGNTFWRMEPKMGSCDLDNYDILYEGQAKLLKDTTVADSPAIVSLISNDTTFALKQIETRIVSCGFSVYHTEDPKLYILESPWPFGNRSLTENLDIFDVNSKFVYVERNIKTKLDILYRKIIRKSCESKLRRIENLSAVAAINPERFAYLLMEGPGYTAIPAGEVIHIIKCVPVEVSTRSLDTCYSELPVTFRNTSYFLSPITRILKKFGTERECSNILPVKFKTDYGWFELSPRPSKTATPIQIRPRTEPKWKFSSVAKLVAADIYTQDDLEKFREQIMFSTAKEAITNNIVRGFIGKSITHEGFSACNVLDENAKNKLKETTAERVWKGFCTFGSASAAVLAIFIIFKFVINTVVRGYALYTVHGCSINLIAAFWGAITLFLLRHSSMANKQTNDQQPPQIVVTQPPPIDAWTPPSYENLHHLSE